jgi:cell wall-associated NlpC family hydrolase
LSARARGAGHRLLTILLASLFLTLGSFAVAQAEPQSITAAKQEAAALAAQVDELNGRMDSAVDQYNTATATLAQTERRIKTSQAQLDKAQKDLKTASQRLGKRANGIYKDGQMGFWEAVFSAQSFSEFINRLNLLSRVGAQDGQILQQIETFRTDVTAKKTQLDADRATQTKLVAQTKQAKAGVEAQLSERARMLKGKERVIAQLQQEEAARQATLRAQLAVAKASQSSSGSKSGSTSRGSSPVPAGDVPSSQAGGSAAGVAERYLGVPYVWGGASPSGFDCSGLVQYVYAKLGIDLPHSSQMQWGCGTPVARSQLEPGDLVFFGSDIHHVGIYVGGGSMIHAPHTGAVVSYSSVDRSDYAGARRLR